MINEAGLAGITLEINKLEPDDLEILKVLSKLKGTGEGGKGDHGVVSGGVEGAWEREARVKCVSRDEDERWEPLMHPSISRFGRPAGRRSSAGKGDIEEQWERSVR